MKDFFAPNLPEERFDVFVDPKTGTRFGETLSHLLLKDPQTGKFRKELFYVASTNLVSFIYDHPTKELRVEFRNSRKQRGGGPIYLYRFVPERVFLELSRAASKGVYFYHRIRMKFPYSRIRG
jgi:hypothetical protein